MSRILTLDDGAGRTVTLSTAPNTDDVLVDVAGWYGGVGARAERVDRLGDGHFPARVTREGRKLTVEGLVIRATGREVEAYERMLSGMFPSGMQSGSLRVTGSNGEASALGLQLDGEVKIAGFEDRPRLRFSIPLVAPDPYLYGPVQQTTAFTEAAGQGLVFPLFDDEQGVETGALEFGVAPPPPAELANAGNALAYPTARISGSFPNGFRLSFTADGKAFGVTWRSTVFPGAPVLVDMRGSVTVGGVDQSWALSQRAWGGVEPGQVMTCAVSALSAEGQGAAEVALRSTYM